MSAPIDFAAITALAVGRSVLGDKYLSQDEDAAAAGEMLAARVPALCRACRGNGYVPMDSSEVPGSALNDGAAACSSFTRTCSDCPSLAKLLAIGAAVMTTFLPSHGYGPGTRDTLLRLRAVEPQS